MIVRLVLGGLMALGAGLLPTDDHEELDRLRRERERLIQLQDRIQRGERIDLEEIAGSWGGRLTNEIEVAEAHARLLDVERRFLAALESLQGGATRARPQPGPDATGRSVPAPKDPERALAGAQPPTPLDTELHGIDAIPDPERLADLLYETAQFEKALEVYRSITEPTPRREPKILYWTARCLERLGQEEEAVAMLQKLANGYPDSSWMAQASWTLDFLERSRGMRDLFAEAESSR